MAALLFSAHEFVSSLFVPLSLTKVVIRECLPSELESRNEIRWVIEVRLFKQWVDIDCDNGVFQISLHSTPKGQLFTCRTLVERLMYFTLLGATRKDATRSYPWLRLPSLIAPCKIAICSDQNKATRACKKTLDHYGITTIKFNTDNQEFSSAIQRADELGVPFVLTIDSFDEARTTIFNVPAMIRDRDSQKKTPKNVVDIGETIRLLLNSH